MKRALFLPLCFILSLNALATDVYRWKDENGVFHFGDRPPANADTDSDVVTIEPNVYSNPNVEKLSPTFAASTEVVMYSTAWCGFCRKAREYFRANRIPFKEYDVETTAKGKRDYMKLNAAGVPVIVIGKQRLNGFSEEAFRRIYDAEMNSS